ncbi:MAG: ATPase, T2SS/T4P/T4SS family [Candidatus Omnitrophica bacterium]|nr:ATPase, T2SS/T4P/T4SS family [Candidatus Omnitrophota bacterium]MDD5488546.1 ATPase, T2SS/T4P/T4SS family [Candidatus Omnitrophota bacterium]
MQKRALLGDLLVSKGLVKAEDIQAALEEQKRSHRPLGHILVERNLITESDLLLVLAQQLEYPYVNIAEEEIEPDAMNAVTFEMCESLNIIPLGLDGKNIKVAMADPMDLNVIDMLQEATGMTVLPHFAASKDIRQKLEKIRSGASVEQAAGDEMNELALGGSTIKIVDDIIEKAIELRASDIHLDAEEEQMKCRMRIDGVLIVTGTFPKEMKAPLVSRIKIMSGVNIAERRLPQDGRINVKVRDKDIDLRVSTFPTVFGECIVMRVLDKSKGIYKLDEIGMDKQDIVVFRRIINRPYGMFFVCGPTGSGKSTTLYAALNEMDKIENNVITMEDPVEYQMPQVKQAQVNVKAGFTFATGLRAILRQDPDIIMIGEVRDVETAEIAIQSALTGHLVFSTIHTNDAVSSVARLLDMGVEPFLIASSLIGVLAQRLVRRLCPECKKPVKNIPEEVAKKFGITPEEEKNVFQPTGCPKCNMTGYYGRCGVFELLEINDNIREKIVKNASQQEIKETALASGMRALMDCAKTKVIAGITSIEEALLLETK